MNFFLALGDGNGFAAGGRNQVDLADFAFIVFRVFSIAFTVAGVGGVGIFFGGRFALGAEGYPAAVGRPFGIDIVS